MTGNPFERLGLPIPTPLNETEEERRQRIGKIESLPADVFRVTAAYVGRSQAQRLFEKATKRESGGQKGSRSPERDHKLLEIYDNELAISPNVTIPEVARHIDESARGEFGNSWPSIAKHLRRLLDDRRQTHAKFWTELEACRAEYGKYPGLLGDLWEPEIKKPSNPVSTPDNG
jgi:hypothetical protein